MHITSSHCAVLVQAAKTVQCPATVHLNRHMYGWTREARLIIGNRLSQPDNMLLPSQHSLHLAPIFRLLLKVAVKGMHQCDLSNFCRDSVPNNQLSSAPPAKKKDKNGQKNSSVEQQGSSPNALCCGPQQSTAQFVDPNTALCAWFARNSAGYSYSAPYCLPDACICKIHMCPLRVCHLQHCARLG